MKKSIIALPALILSLFLASCGGGSVPSSQSVSSEAHHGDEPSVSQADSSILVASSEGGASSVDSAPSADKSDSEVAPEGSSDEKTTESEQSSEAVWVDYVHDGTVKLNLDYKDHTFYEDGIEQVSLKTAIDGDTAHFTPLSGGKTIKSRFYGIDTPESTGKIQDYGIPASDYTKGILKKADKSGTIVVSSAQSDYGIPKFDSTGSRYVSLIWVNTEKKNASFDELYLLNLAIVQEGLSWVKNVADMPDYVNTFYAAEQQARDFKLNIFSGLPDPAIPHGDYEMTSLLDIKHEIVANMKDPSHPNAFDNKKVRLQGTVAGYANNILFLQDYFPAVDEEGRELDDVPGEYAGINIFTGMGGISSDFTTRGNYIEICGISKDSENFGFQVSGVTFLDFPMRDTDAHVIYYEDENDSHPLYTADYTASELSAAINAGNGTEYLYCAVNITDSFKVTDGYTSDEGDVTLKLNQKWQIYLTTVYSPVDGTFWRSHENFIGKTFTIKGVLTTHKTQSGYYQFQIVPSRNSDLVLISE